MTEMQEMEDRYPIVECAHSPLYRWENERNGGFGCPLCQQEEREAERAELNRRIDAGETPAEATEAVDGGRCVVCGRFHEYSWKECADMESEIARSEYKTVLSIQESFI